MRTPRGIWGGPVSWHGRSRQARAGHCKRRMRSCQNAGPDLDARDTMRRPAADAALILWGSSRPWS